MKIVKLIKEIEYLYEEFIDHSLETTFYHTLKYRELLKRFLGDRDHYLLAVDKENIVQGVMPLFIKINKKCGNVMNSLPFYGSIGAILGNSEEAKNDLLIKYKELLKDYACVSGTIITSPFEKNIEWYQDKLEPEFQDVRIGQVTFLPSGKDYEEKLMTMFRVTTRKAIRKASIQNFEVINTNSQEISQFLEDEHKRNMDEIGGISKPSYFFKLIPDIFKYGTDYKIYAAKLDEKIVAAVLIFYFKGTIEYFTPVIVKEYRNSQPLSLLIFEAMKDASKEGRTKWNWGGTWLSQDGVYRFKSGWGAKDMKYYYYINIMNKKILKLDKQEILENYPYYYVYPFS